eukprot:8609875-Lingulodinium_polyedra.AAC.1
MLSVHGSTRDQVESLVAEAGLAADCAVAADTRRVCPRAVWVASASHAGDGLGYDAVPEQERTQVLPIPRVPRRPPAGGARCPGGYALWAI